MPDAPTVSVLMPVYNVAGTARHREYLATAVHSILAQDYDDWELVAVNDGSADATGPLLDGYARTDPRVRVLHLAKNVGIAAALNAGAAFARGRLLARMDADDISLPYRLRTQVGFLQRHPGIDLVGSGMYVVNEDSQVLRETRLAECHEDILRAVSTWGCPFIHGSVLMRRAVFDRVGGYCPSPEWHFCEDFEMWFRVLCVGRGHNLPECLYLYREHTANVSTTKRERQAQAAAKVKAMFAARFPDLLTVPAPRAA
jgi:glycosyltransferase involved in cell wall biosynthesis